MEIFVGVDFAADPKNTGLATLKGTELIGVGVGATDADILAAVARSARAGIDVPIGWPRPFTDFIAAHARGQQTVPEDSGPDWRRRLAWRRTDFVVKETTGLNPLSVSTDRIAHPALRWAAIEARLGATGVNTARDGSGAIAEVYPAAALTAWGLPCRGYKGNKGHAVRRHIVQQLSHRVHFGEYEEAVLANDNALDAVIAALVAREITAGRTRWPGDAERATALIEGWIHVPVSSE
ncbi:DUF429 domain-containing protein [Corynebacterium atypicum]|uniref:DUF429 domain-containing protein n=1 Tax=Corynebacterium atypicum TaxID=191610 RepID=UPI000B27D2C4|nr:DUF429 domain-containing protein [Corynebacterium atypicum]